MERDKVDEYLQAGMYGPKEVKPEERKRFLGTLRERIVVALTQAQVRKADLLPRLEMLMKENPKAHLLLNGQIEYTVLSKYSKMANRLSIPFTIVNNQEVETDIGLVLAYDYAIEKDDIFINNEYKVKLDSTVEKGNLFTKIKKKLF